MEPEEAAPAVDAEATPALEGAAPVEAAEVAPVTAAVEACMQIGLGGGGINCGNTLGPTKILGRFSLFYRFFPDDWRSLSLR